MDDRLTQLVQAIEAEDCDRARDLVRDGIDLNAPCQDGATALMIAVLCGNREIVKLMLEHGADPNLHATEPAATVLCPCPLDLAMQARFLMSWDRYHPIAVLLQEHGAVCEDGTTDSPHEVFDLERAARERQGQPRSEDS